MEFREIERKFLVKGEEFKQFSTESYPIQQGFLSSDPERVVRIRLSGEQGWITVKGLGDQSGRSRFEWEKEISAEEARALLELCEPGRIDKRRYTAPYKGHLFEVDEFFGENEGLIIAEIELQSIEQSFEVPEWLGREVTGEKAYYNSQLSKNPYCRWERP